MTQADKPLTDDELETIRAKHAGAGDDFFVTYADIGHRLIAELIAWRKAGRDIKSRVVGERAPHWFDKLAITTSRVFIADQCDALLPPDPKAEEQKP